jgi:hypothetical protein
MRGGDAECAGRVVVAASVVIVAVLVVGCGDQCLVLGGSREKHETTRDGELRALDHTPPGGFPNNVQVVDGLVLVLPLDDVESPKLQPSACDHADF